MTPETLLTGVRAILAGQDLSVGNRTKIEAELPALEMWADGAYQMNPAEQADATALLDQLRRAGLWAEPVAAPQAPAAITPPAKVAEAASGPPDASAISFCAGHGADAAANKLFKLTWPRIIAAIKSPQQVPKLDADWFVTCDANQRTHDACTRPTVRSGALVFEFDLNPPSLRELSAAVMAVFGDVEHAAYTTASATKAAPRCRLLVPVRVPLDPHQREASQQLMHDALLKRGHSPDATANHPEHVQFMPNNPPGRGPDAIYEHMIHAGLGRADPLALWAGQIAAYQPKPVRAEGEAHLPVGLGSVIKDADEALLRDALKQLDASDRPTWIAVCGALAGSGETGFRLFHDWSSTATSGYKDEADCREKFDELAKTPKSGYPAIFTMAQGLGWSMSRVAGTSFDAPASEVSWGFEAVDIARLMRDPPRPTRWLFRQRVPANRGGLLTGVGGTSKTQLLYQMAIAAILGHCPWGWHVERTGKAVLILTEDDVDDPHVTLHTIRAAMTLTPEQLSAVEAGLIVYPLAGEDLKLLVRDPKSGALVGSSHLRALEEKINDTGGVVFVGIDPALGVSEGDEASQSDQRALGRMADNLAVRCDCSVLALSHATKGSLQSDELTSHSSRGGGAITDAVRVEYAMRTLTAKEAPKYGINDIAERESYVQLKATKGNRIPPEAKVPVWFKRGHGGFLEIAELAEVEAGGISPNARRVLNVMAEMDPANHGVRLLDLRQRCAELHIIGGPTDDAKKKAMTRILKSLGSRIAKDGQVRGSYRRAFIDFDDEVED